MSFLQVLRDRAGARQATLVFPEGLDPRVQEAAGALAAQGLAKPILLGPELSLRRGLAPSPRGAVPRILDPAHDGEQERFEALYAASRAGRDASPEQIRAAAVDPLVRAALMVAAGDADGLVAGSVYATGDVVRTGIQCIGPAEGIRTVSSSFYMVVPAFRHTEAEVLTFTDAGVVPHPDAEQLADIAVAAADARRLVVGDEPRVAFLSYSTHGSAEGPTVEMVREALRLFRDKRPDVVADGELQVDAALVFAVADRKAPDSPVAGRANVLVFPDLNAGNIAYKLVQRLAGATALGPILQGLARPCNDLSRGAWVEDVIEVACITSVMAQGDA
jgi:phosphate acetyltransferase